MPSKTTHFCCCFLPQALFLLLGCAVYLGTYFGTYFGIWGGNYWLLLPTLFLLLVVPLLDALTGWRDAVNLNKRDFAAWQITLLQWNTRLYAIFHVLALMLLVYYAARFSIWQLALLLPAMGMISVIAFAAAHELMHSPEKADHWLQYITTKFLFYPHYQLIHIRSHHPLVGTDQDQNTAWRDESIYAYLLRTIPGSARRCWQLEAKRLADQPSRLARFYKNQMVAHVVGQVILLAALYGLAGPRGLLFFLAQTVFAHLVLESVNYMQHYGLLRQRTANGYQRMQAQHSWDTYHFFSSYVTFRVGHHASHHLAAKPYYLLGTEQNAPQLPTGYFVAISALFVPWLWRRWIHPRIKTAQQE